VLFSNEQVATFINNNFEPAWESVRPVPIVRIDFGNGTVLTRTLNGNIATSVCTRDGDVLDVLPGIYQPEAYLEQLDQFRLLARYANKAMRFGVPTAAAKGVAQQPAAAHVEKPKTPEELRAEVVKSYHETQAKALADQGVAAKFVVTAGMSKAVIEDPIKLVLGVPGDNPSVKPAPKDATKQEGKTLLEKPDEVASWKTLAEDTKLNETVRRKLIHEMLAKKGLAKPEKLTKAIYKDVLHADLDDPYLGLGESLFAGYPFSKEDKGH
jgi:hypothetical protein